MTRQLHQKRHLMIRKSKFTESVFILLSIHIKVKMYIHSIMYVMVTCYERTRDHLTLSAKIIHSTQPVLINNLRTKLDI